MLSIISAGVWLIANHFTACEFRDGKARFTIEVIERLILGFSDQQLVTGIALLATVQMKICEISVYHYLTVLMLGTISGCIHMMTLYILKGYFKTTKLATWWRFAGIITHIVLSVVALVNISPLLHSRILVDLRWPLRCLGHKLLPSYPSANDYSLTYIKFLWPSILIIISGSVTSWWRITLNRFILRWAFSFFAFIFFGVWILKVRTEMKKFLDGNENTWGFGQIMPNILLLVNLFSAIEFYSGKSFNLSDFRIALHINSTAQFLEWRRELLLHAESTMVVGVETHMILNELETSAGTEEIQNPPLTNSS